LSNNVGWAVAHRSKRVTFLKNVPDTFNYPWFLIEMLQLSKLLYKTVSKFFLHSPLYMIHYKIM
jgi:hypothetical protein